jgi:uncharacterized protein (DUF1697 family)
MTYIILLKEHPLKRSVFPMSKFLSSGNVIFEAASRDSAALHRKIEAHLAKSLGHEVSTFVRTDAEVAAIACYRPFTEKKLESALAFNVAFLAEPMDAATSRSVQNFNTDIDSFQVHGREVYWLCCKKQSESTFSNNAFEKPSSCARPSAE